jgi:hypothetical protein
LWREIARSNQKRGKQADEHGGNQRRMKEQSFDVKQVMASPRIARDGLARQANCNPVKICERKMVYEQTK